MSQYVGVSQYSHEQAVKTGVLLINLGTPDAPTTKALRRYLAEFLWDPRVVEVPRLIWWLVLHLVILRLRPRRSAKSYKKIWTEQGSPLRVYSCQLAEALQVTMDEQFPEQIKVILAMRYGQPSVAQELKVLHDAGVNRLLVLPLYPQYSATTTASCFDAVSKVLIGWRWLPEVRFVSHYHDDSGYIEAVANSIRASWQDRQQGEKLVFSFHGIPQRYFDNGDPYFCECQKTARLIAESLALSSSQWLVTFQSRFGREPWLQPYTDMTLKKLATEGVKRIDVVCPGFACDCLETLEEIAVENRDYFLQAGGEVLHYISALNSQPQHVAALGELLKKNLEGWSVLDNAEQRAATARRAIAKGAAK
ncbi:MAG: ferrochelatase [Gammaproteobacteria bacterium]|nr:ferrochelatase [Gammaproteobacteria bacterium]